MINACTKTYVKQIKTYIRNTTTGNKSKHYMIPHTHEKTNQLYKLEVALNFVGSNQPKFFRYFRGKSILYLF